MCPAELFVHYLKWAKIYKRSSVRGTKTKKFLPVFASCNGLCYNHLTQLDAWLNADACSCARILLSANCSYILLTFYSHCWLWTKHWTKLPLVFTAIFTFPCVFEVSSHMPLWQLAFCTHSSFHKLMVMAHIQSICGNSTMQKIMCIQFKKFR